MEQVIFLDRTGSTNTYVKKNWHTIPDGCAVCTFRQEAGRGRLNRVWISPPGKCIALSIAFRHLESGFHAGCIAGLAVLALLRREAPEISAYLKWPNDVYSGCRKLCGILCEGVIEHGRLAGVVAGIGINVNLEAADLAGAGQPAVSLKELAGREFPLEKLSLALAKELNRYYIKYQSCIQTVLDEWRCENRLLGRTIQVVDPSGRSYEGVFTAITSDGALRLQCGDSLHTFSCGDVRIDMRSVRRDIGGTPPVNIKTKGV